jgi:FkbM family methyltransferase
MMSLLRNVLKKVVPDPCVNLVLALRAGVSLPWARRARRLGLKGKQLKDFLKLPDGASKLDKLNINGGPKNVAFLKESKCFIIESIFDDAYQLESIEWPRNQHIKIVDIGANVGTFAIAARGEFPNATIHCYEVNPFLRETLALHAYDAGAKLFMEGVGLTTGSFSLDTRPNQSNGSNSVAVVDFTKEGTIPIVPLKEVAARLGGRIDLLKMDCEGSEWIILRDLETLKHIHYISVEYHRISPDHSFDLYDFSINIQNKAIDTLKGAGFDIVKVRTHTRDAGIILAKNRSFI